jgi:DNA mismatch repair protein MutL
LDPIGIYGDRSYILCELGGDLLLIDQHAAHERIKLEMLQKKFNRGKGGIQELLEPIHVELDHSALERFVSLGPALSELVFIIEPFGDDCVVIRGLPRFMGRTEAHSVVSDMLYGCEVPLHCAHGRPTMIRLPLSILERWFRRVL